MTHDLYILKEARLPWHIDRIEDEEQALLNAAPRNLWGAVSRAHGKHQVTVHAGDAISDWIAANWRKVLPEMSKKFPPPCILKLPEDKGFYSYTKIGQEVMLVRWCQALHDTSGLAERLSLEKAREHYKTQKAAGASLLSIS